MMAPLLLLCSVLLLFQGLAVAVEQEAPSSDGNHTSVTTTNQHEVHTAVEDDRSWLDVFGDASHEFLTTQLIPPTDASCVWDWRVARCEPFCHCAFLPAWGDYHLGRSCRYRPNHEVVCAPPTTLTFDHLRLEYSQEEQEQQEQEQQDPPALKQLLFQTVKALQTTRDYLQKWTLQIQQKTQHRYEHLQEQTCATLLVDASSSSGTATDGATCVPPADLSWKQALLCQGWEAVCDEHDNHNHHHHHNHDHFNWRKKLPQSWKLLWNKIRHFQQHGQQPPPHETEAEADGSNEAANHNNVPSEFSSLLPNWSTASDWSAGIAKPKPRRRKPRIGGGLNKQRMRDDEEGDDKGFAAIHNNMQRTSTGSNTNLVSETDASGTTTT